MRRTGHGRGVSHLDSPRPMAAPSDAARDPRRQPPLPRRGGRRLRRQVGHRLRRGRPGAGARQADQAAGPEPRPVRPLVRDRRGHRLLLAQPPDRRGRRARHVHRHLARHARDARGQRAQARARGRDRRVRRRRAAVPRRIVRSGPGPRRAPPPAGARPLVRRVRARAAPRRDAVLRRRALASGRPHRRVAEARRHARRAALAPGGEGATGVTTTAGRRAPTTPSTRSSRWSTCTRSTPATSSG